MRTSDLVSIFHHTNERIEAQGRAPTCLKSFIVLVVKLWPCTWLLRKWKFHFSSYLGPTYCHDPLFFSYLHTAHLMVHHQLLSKYIQNQTIFCLDCAVTLILFALILCGNIATHLSPSVSSWSHLRPAFTGFAQESNQIGPLKNTALNWIWDATKLRCIIILHAFEKETLPVI